MSGKHAKSVFYQGISIINVFHVILYIKIYFAQTTLCIVIVVNRRCDASNAISKFQWIENWRGSKTAPVTIYYYTNTNDMGFTTEI